MVKFITVIVIDHLYSPTIRANQSEALNVLSYILLNVFGTRISLISQTVRSKRANWKSHQW